MDTKLEFNWLPKQQAATDAADTHKYTLFGGYRGGSKSYWLRWYSLKFLVECGKAGLKRVHTGMFCEDYPALTDRQITKMEAEFPSGIGKITETRHSGLGFYLNKQLGGGVICLRNLDDPNKYKSAEFALIAIDQLEQNPLDKFNLLRGSLRWPGMKNVRFIAGANPGGVGHLWVRDYWGIQKKQELPDELLVDAQEFIFIESSPRDNPYLDSEYWQMLKTLPEELRRAWLEGDWSIFAGQAFTTFRHQAHVIEPFTIPAHWTRWRSVDWGSFNPFCCLWLAKDPDTGRVIVYREVYERSMTDRQQARMIKDNSPASEHINITFADPSMWTSKTREDVVYSTADEYAAEGVYLTKADNDRLTGKRKVDTLLANLPDGKPGLQIFNTCTNLIRTLPALPRDKVNPELPDDDAEDHAYEALKDGLTQINIKPAPSKEEQDRFRKLQRKQSVGMGNDF